LGAAGLSLPSTGAGSDGADFARWYLEVVQLLEAHVAANDDHPPMTRDDVEMMCRCCLTARNLEEVIHLLQRFCQMLYPRSGKIELREAASGYYFVTDSMRRRRTMASSLVDIAGLFAFKQLFHWLTGGLAKVNQVGIGAILREDLLPFLRLFDAPVVAEGKQPYLRFDKDAMDVAVVASAGDFDLFFQRFPADLFTREIQLGPQVAAMLTAAIRQALPVPTQAEVAEALGMALSTFRRHLAEQGTSFRTIREACLCEASFTLLDQREYTVERVAQRLGYRDADTFRRAFRRWTGTSPQAYRMS
jgi:AraC-like DNA-binding protein